MTTFNEFQTIKRRFFALRNGIIADTLRKGGSPFNIIFGLNLPQIVEIAAETPHRADLAQRLWDNNSTRESMLLAPVIMPADEVSTELAKEWIDTAPSTEIIDNLCHKLLRHTPLMPDLAFALAGEESSARRYAAMRLFWPLLATHQTRILDVAKAEVLRADPMTAGVATQIVNEIEWLNA